MRGVGYTLGAVGAIAVVLLLVLAMFKAKIIGLDDNPYADGEESRVSVPVIAKVGFGRKPGSGHRARLSAFGFLPS